MKKLFLPVAIIALFGNFLVLAYYVNANRNNAAKQMQGDWLWMLDDDLVFDAKGNIFATELTRKLKGQFPDYVFAKDYQLLSFSELGLFISKNKHLPNIPNAKDVEKNGLSIGEMQAKQMEKIEELTLYILELNKRLSSLEKENKNLKENK